MLGDGALALGAHSALEDDGALFDSDRQVVYVQPLVPSEVFEDDAPELAVAQVVQLVQVFEIARHGSPRVATGAPPRAYRPSKYDSPIVNATLCVQNELIVAEVKLQPQPSGAEVCSYNCLLSVQLASLDQRI
jgi:hypothetical protein